MKELLRRLCSIPGVSSWEDRVRECVMDVAGQYATELRVDAMGNVIAFKEGDKATGNKLLLTAHMDEVGLIVTRVCDDGFLKFDFVGGVDRRVTLGKEVFLGWDRIPAVVGMKAVHMLSAEERKRIPKTESLYLDIGAPDRQSALALVEPGTYGAFAPRAETFGDGMFRAKAIDDRVGCAILLELLSDAGIGTMLTH